MAGCSQPGGLWFDGGQNWAKITIDLRKLFSEGIRALVSLTEQPLPVELVRAEGLEYLHLPVLDMQPPQIEDVNTFIKFVVEAQEKEQPVVVHCQAGLGRTGTMLACYLVFKGSEPAEAIRLVRHRRPGSVETEQQEALVWEYAELVQKAAGKSIRS